jgi:hypothetical protein
VLHPAPLSALLPRISCLPRTLPRLLLRLLHYVLATLQHTRKKTRFPVSQEGQATPPKAPQGYEGTQSASPPVRASPGDVAEVTTPTPEPRPLSAAPSTSVGTVSAGIVFPLATPADDLLPTFPTDEESDAGAQRPSPMNVDSERASQEAALNKSPPRSAVPTSEPKRYRLDVPVSLESESEEEDSFGNRPIAPTRVFLDSDGPPKGVHIILLGGSPGFGV